MDPHDYPLSSQDEPVVFSAMDDVLTEAMGAEGSYEWTHLTSASVGLTLLSGECDLIIGMTEGAAGLSNTVPFARIPYVFISLAERDIDISSLNNPQLEKLHTGTYMADIPSMAL